MGSNARNGARTGATVDDLIDELKPLGRSILVPVTAPTIAVRPRSRLRPIHPPKRAAAAWACVGLGVLLGIAMPYWPYARACGWELSFYLFSVGMVVIAGVWGLRITWKSRLGFAHTVALGTMLWGLTLTAETVLPRVGYTKIAQAWTCPAR